MVALALRAGASFGAAIGRIRLLRAVLVTLAVGMCCVALALGGIWLGLWLSTPVAYPSALGSASFQVKLSSHGEVEAFIPLADWGLRAHAFSAPLTLHVEPRVLNRQALIAAASGNRAVLARTARDLSHDGHLALERATRYAFAGLLAAAVLGWGVLRVYHYRGRRLLVALPLGTVVAGLLIGGASAWRVGSTWSSDALAHPVYYARGAELVQLLNAAQHGAKVKDSYVSKVEGALSDRCH
jgi:hypothetical protein